MKPTEYIAGVDVLDESVYARELLEHLEAQGAEIVFPGEVPSWLEAELMPNPGRKPLYRIKDTQ